MIWLALFGPVGLVLLVIVVQWWIEHRAVMRALEQQHQLSMEHLDWYRREQEALHGRLR